MITAMKDKESVKEQAKRKQTIFANKVSSLETYSNYSKLKNTAGCEKKRREEENKKESHEDSTHQSLWQSTQCTFNE